jgi:outer membrane receptor protein involved in Fe transport
MERVEVLKGPQNTLFGRSAQFGAIDFISKTPGNKTDGYLTAGFGNYNQKEFRAAVNVPVIKDKLFVRAAGLYDARDGFVENSFGGTLNGKNTIAGRFSVRFLPSVNQKMDLVINYQKDDAPGVAFMNKQFPNSLGETDIFNYRASLEQGENLGTGKKLFDATLNYKYSFNEHTYLTSITSYRKSSASARFDGDGTASAALDMTQNSGANQFYQELRFNFSLNSRLNGSAGASYWHENADDAYLFSTNEQNLVFLFLPGQSSYLIMPNGLPMALPALPDNPAFGPLAGMPLQSNHQETNSSTATNQAADLFADVTYQLTDKLFFKGGLRATRESFKLNYQAALVGVYPSTLSYLIPGQPTGPNLLFKPSPETSTDNTSYSVNWQGGLQYKFDENTNIFANYSNGRRPKILQFNQLAMPQLLNAERVNNFDLGVKTILQQKIYVDVVGFYEKYTDFQTKSMIAGQYLSIDAGRATSYGAEASVKASLLKGLELFGNYAYLHSTFDDTDKDGAKQEYAGKTFSLSPKHSFTLGFNAHAKLSSKVGVFVTPSYVYKTKFYFEDTNTAGLDQEAFGLLNVNCGFELAEPKIVLSFFGTNITDERYVTSAGNMGSLFGVPTFVPGAPRMIGTKLTWKF